MVATTRTTQVHRGKGMADMTHYPRTIRANRHNGVTQKATPRRVSARGHGTEVSAPMQAQNSPLRGVSASPLISVQA